MTTPALVSVAISSLLLAPALALAAFDIDLRQGARGTAVVELQQFLIVQGHLATGNATGYFGVRTLAGVKAFQAAKGIQPVSGFFGPLTRAAAKAAGGFPPTISPSGNPQSPQITALLRQVQELQAKIAQLKSVPTPTSESTFSVIPTSGTAPLTVTANFEKTSSCGQYTLTWGDGTNSNSPAPASTADCLSAFFPVSLTHTYTAPGTYTVTHDTAYAEPVSRMVIVSSVACCDPKPTFSATPTSGSAPLSVWFSTNLMSNQDTSNYVINFCDGASNGLAPIEACTAQSEQGQDPCVVRMGGNHIYATAGTYTAKLYAYDPNLVDCNATCPAPVGTATIVVSGSQTQFPLVMTDKVSYNAGNTIKVTCNNPVTPGSKDWVGIVQNDAAWLSTPDLGEWKSWAWVSGVSGGFANLVAPAATGNYQIIYFRNTTDGSFNTSSAVTRSSPFTVYSPSVTAN
jgi:peptidoglycan hydrolase-like protein with peptidoglycan-binding domain